MKKYTIKKFKNNFKPLDNPFPIFGKKEFEIKFKLTESCYFSFEDWEGDRDWNDWNIKIKGITKFFSLNNSTSAMLAARPTNESNTFEIAAYINTKDRKFKYETLFFCIAGEEMNIKIGWTNKHKVQFITENKTISFDLKRPSIMREIGTSFGGANNSKGNYGGIASQEMTLHAELIKI